jgi:hypothetical protein
MAVPALGLAKPESGDEKAPDCIGDVPFPGSTAAPELWKLTTARIGRIAAARLLHSWFVDWMFICLQLQTIKFRVFYQIGRRYTTFARTPRHQPTDAGFIDLIEFRFGHS